MTTWVPGPVPAIYLIIAALVDTHMFMPRSSIGRKRATVCGGGKQDIKTFYSKEEGFL